MGRLIFTKRAGSSTPEAGKVALYAKNDGKLYVKKEDGTESEVGSGGGGGEPVDYPITIDKGGTGATTAQAALNAITNVAAASDGYVLTKIGGAVSWAAPSNGSGAEAGLPDPTGSNSNDVLVSTGTAYTLVDDTQFVSAAGAVMKSSLSSKGALLSASAPGIVSVLSAGTNGKTLVTNSATPSGLEWVDRVTVTGGVANALPRLTGPNTLAASGITVSADTLTIPEGGGLVSNGLTMAKAGLTVNGNITVTGNVDGRDVGNDGAKLDGIKKDNTSATTDPGTSNNTSQGYSVGSRWINTTPTPAKQFVCTAATSNSATWKDIGAGSYSQVTNTNAYHSTLPVVVNRADLPAGNQSSVSTGLFAYGIKPGANVTATVVKPYGQNDPDVTQHYLQISAPDVVTKTELSSYGTDLTPANQSTNMTIGIKAGTYASLIMGAPERGYIDFTPLRPSNFAPPSGANLAAKYHRMKTSRGLLVGDSPAVVQAFAMNSPVVNLSMAPGFDFRYLYLAELTSIAATSSERIPFQSGILHFSGRMLATIGPDTSTGVTSVPQFRWYLVLSKGKNDAPLLAENANQDALINSTGYIAASGIVYAPVDAYKGGESTPTLNEDTSIYFDIFLNLSVNETTGVWTSRPYGAVHSANRNEDSGSRFGQTSVTPTSETSYTLGTITSGTPWGFGDTDTPRMSLYISQSGGLGASKFNLTRWGYGRGGVNIKEFIGSATFAPRLVDRNGAIATPQYRLSNGTFGTY